MKISLHTGVTVFILACILRVCGDGIGKSFPSINSDTLPLPVKLLPEEPGRPIIETVIGGVMTGFGITCLPVGAYLLSRSKKWIDWADPNDDLDMNDEIGYLIGMVGAVISLEGLGFTLAGSFVLWDAGNRWRRYNRASGDTRIAGLKVIVEY